VMHSSTESRYHAYGWTTTGLYVMIWYCYRGDDVIIIIRKTDLVVVIISDAYLKSVACLYEIMQLLKDEDWIADLKGRCCGIP